MAGASPASHAMALPRNRCPLPKCDAPSRATIVYTIVYRTPYKRRYPCSITSLDHFQSAELLNSVIKWQEVGAEPTELLNSVVKWQEVGAESAELLNSVVEQQRVGVEAPCEYSDKYSDVANAWCCRNFGVKAGDLYQYELMLIVVRGLLNCVEVVKHAVNVVNV